MLISQVELQLSLTAVTLDCVEERSSSSGNKQFTSTPIVVKTQHLELPCVSENHFADFAVHYSLYA